MSQSRPKKWCDCSDNWTLKNTITCHIEFKQILLLFRFLRIDEVSFLPLTKTLSVNHTGFLSLRKIHTSACECLKITPKTTSSRIIWHVGAQHFPRSAQHAEQFLVIQFFSSQCTVRLRPTPEQKNKEQTYEDCVGRGKQGYNVREEEEEGGHTQRLDRRAGKIKGWRLWDELGSVELRSGSLKSTLQSRQAGTCMRTHKCHSLCEHNRHTCILGLTQHQ